MKPTAPHAAAPGWRTTRSNGGLGDLRRRSKTATVHVINRGASRYGASANQILGPSKVTKDQLFEHTHANPTAVTATRTIESSRVNSRFGGFSIVSLGR